MISLLGNNSSVFFKYNEKGNITLEFFTADGVGKTNWRGSKIRVTFTQNLIIDLLSVLNAFKKAIEENIDLQNPKVKNYQIGDNRVLSFILAKQDDIFVFAIKGQQEGLSLMYKSRQPIIDIRKLIAYLKIWPIAMAICDINKSKEMSNKYYRNGYSERKSVDVDLSDDFPNINEMPF